MDDTELFSIAVDEDTGDYVLAGYSLYYGNGGFLQMRDTAGKILWNKKPILTPSHASL